MRDSLCKIEGTPTSLLPVLVGNKSPHSGRAEVSKVNTGPTVCLIEEHTSPVDRNNTANTDTDESTDHYIDKVVDTMTAHKYGKRLCS